MSTFKRILSFVLAMVMVVGMLPMPHVHAAETETTPTAEETIVTEPTAQETAIESTVAPVTKPEESATEPKTQPIATEATEIAEETETETLPEETVSETVSSVADSSTLATGSCGKNLIWEYESGILTITGTGKMYDYSSNSSVPWYSFARSITELSLDVRLTSIGKYAFYRCSSLTSVTIPDSVVSIGAYAFYGCSSLTSVTIPDSVTSIGYSVFYDCTGLASVTIGNGVTSIGSSAFYGCSNLTDVHITDLAAWCGISFADAISNPTRKAEGLILNGEYITDLVIPEGVTSIGSYAFYNCTRLTTITIPDSVVSIGSKAFLSCSNLTSITIPDSVASIGGYAFYACTGLTSVTIPDSVVSIGALAFSDCSKLTDVHITDLAAWCSISFADNTANPTWNDVRLILNGEYITDLVIPEGVTSIGSYAFYNCTGLTSVTIPDSVTSIGSNTFYGCSNVTEVHITDLAAWCGISFSGFASNPTYCTSGLKGLILNGEAITELVIPEGVTNIRYAFSGCTGLTSVTIPDSVTSIGDYAFYKCTGLTSVTIPDSVTSIGDYAFYHCSSLASVTIPDSVTSIGDYAFRDCTGLTSVTIPNGVTNIGSYAFYCCSNLTDVHITDLAAWCGISFAGDTSNPTLYAKGLILNGEYVTELVIPEGVTTISRWAFYNCTGLTTITIPDSVTSIGTYAFCGCSNLTSITIPDSVTSIGDYAFRACTGLTSVTIPDSVTSIGSEAFYNCDSLKTVSVPASVTTISSKAFSNCDSLTAIWVAEGNAKYASDAQGVLFNKDMTTLIRAPGGMVDGYAIPHTVTTVKGRAFENCKKLLAVYIPSNVTTFTGNNVVGNGPFYLCCSRMVLYCEENSRPSAWGTYWNGYGPTTNGMLTVKWGVSAEEGAFWVEDAFGENVVIPDYLSSLPNNAFYGHTKMKSFTIPAGITSLPEKAFYGCTGLTSVTIPDSVASIGNGAFESCSSLTNITIPESITGIATRAFAYSYALKEIKFMGNAPKIGNNAFQSITSTVYYPVNDPSWTAEVMQDYGGSITWKPMCIGSHTSVTTASVAPTCTETGLTEGKHCSVCNEVLVKQEVVDALGHTEVIDEAIAPTCAETGLTEGKHCSVCNEIMVARTVVPALGHTETIDEALPPTCAATGLTEGAHCSVCEEILVAQVVIPATGHSFELQDEQIICVNCNEEMFLRFDQDYVALEQGETVKLEVSPADFADKIEWTIEGDDGIITTNQNVVTASRAGTSYALATIRQNGFECSVRFRVDVSEALVVEGVQLSATKATVELYKTDYTTFDILLKLPQNYSAQAENGEHTFENRGVAIESAKFTDETMAKYFELAVLDDRTVQIVPTAEALENAKSVKGSYKGTVTVVVDGEPCETEILTLSVKKTLPKLKASVGAFNSFCAGQAQPIAITGATVTGIKLDPDKAQPEWLNLKDGILVLNEKAPAKSVSGKVNLLVETAEWAVPTALTLTVKNTYKVPGVKLAATSVTVSNQPGPAAVKLKLVPTNKTDTISGIDITGITAPEGYTVENFNAETGTFTLKTADGFKAGKIELKVNFGTVANTLKLTVKAQAVKLKLSASKVSLNKDLGDVATVAVNCLTAGYDVTAPVLTYDAEMLDVQYADGKLFVATKAAAVYGKTYAVSISAYEGAPAVKLNVAILKQNVVVKSIIKSSGFIDVVRDGTAITVTPTYTNALNVDVDNAAVLKIYSSADKFKVAIAEVKAEDGIFTVGKSVISDHALKYKAQLETVIGETNVKSSMISLTVKMGTAKLTVKSEDTTLFSKDKNDRALVWFETADDTLDDIARVEFKNAKQATMFELIDYGDGTYAIGFMDGKVDKSLIGKTVTVALNVFLEGNQTTKANATANVKLTIVK